ncbi:penicillin-binding protein [Limosilactobacillus caviae]|uniref:Penicillin-binding protein 2B n=1 Tax=Limosilactobacillus caviae TaxID=1769424 RepID=A0ABQ2C5J0_9LACO|nr:penicillin-binding protein [Limosilactobacillus caviae]MCD7123860.1 PASTA domain-containing protein [Limosilactobacillus caviae]MRH46929.1 PASTA domain-containing protein [Limosilactobacillus reuteri]GGI62713.1 penicillin-binding protein 2B [Limosilactobacillus caviae]
MNKKPQRTKNRGHRENRGTFGKWLFLITVGLFTLFIVRFAYIAINKDVQHVNLRSQAEQIYTQQRIIQARRGDIYDADGNALATDTSKYTLYAVLDRTQKSSDGKPLYVKDRQKTAKILSQYINLKPAQIEKALKPKGQAYQVEFGSAGSNLSASTMQKIKKHHLPGINFIATPARQYPEGEFASQIIGMATPKVKTKNGTDETNLVGQLGLEGYFDKELTGVNGLRKDKQDVYGYQIANSKQVMRKAVNGDNIYTTLDSQTQHFLENKINKAYKSSNANSMTAVVMEAKTGKIIAATQRPTLHAENNPVWRNMLVQDAYEPGSVMKILTLAAAIDTGHFNPNATFNSGTWAMGGGKITDWSSSGWGTISYKDAFDMSSNVGFAHVEQDMGADTWMKYIKRFGLLKKVNVTGMGNEVNGYTTFKGALAQANTAFGQGITVNAMQMMQAFSAIGNNGKMMKPYIVSRIVDGNNGKTVKKVKPEVVGHPIKASTAKKVLGYMQGVIYDQKGLGHDYQIKGYRIAGKTATAQIGGAHGYSTGDTNYLYSFVGMAPAKNPKYIMYVTLRQPQNLKKPATKQIASVFNPTMKMLLSQQKVAEKAKRKVITMPNVIGETTQKANSQLSKKGMQVVVVGSKGKVKQQSAEPNQQVLTDQHVILDAGGEYRMPDISGWSSADVQQLAKILKLNVKENGTGYVTQQSISPNTPIKRGTTLTVQYEAKN